MISTLPSLHFIYVLQPCAQAIFVDHIDQMTKILRSYLSIIIYLSIAEAEIT
jgi:hypothetical protein